MIEMKRERSAAPRIDTAARTLPRKNSFSK
jgi:hypothetical protein